MRSKSTNSKLFQAVAILIAVGCVSISAPLSLAQEQTPTNVAAHSTAGSSGSPELFNTPQQAADALIKAADAFEVGALMRIFGPDGDDIVLSGDFAQDRKHATDFA